MNYFLYNVNKKDKPFEFVFCKLGAGTAFESVVAHYERAELPHTLPCHKIYTI